MIANDVIHNLQIAMSARALYSLQSSVSRLFVADLVLGRLGCQAFGKSNSVTGFDRFFAQNLRWRVALFGSAPNPHPSRCSQIGPRSCESNPGCPAVRGRKHATQHRRSSGRVELALPAKPVSCSITADFRPAAPRASACEQDFSSAKNSSALSRLSPRDRSILSAYNTTTSHIPRLSSMQLVKRRQ